MLKLNLKNKSYLLISILILLNGCGGGASSTSSIVNGTQSSFSDLTSEEQETLNNLSTSQQELLAAVNKERSQSRTCGDRGTFPAVPALTWNPDLYAAALEHVTDLAYSNTFSHDGSGTSYDITGNGSPSKFYERIAANGYADYFSVGENIAGGQRSLSEVMEAWMASPGHCVNIMKNTYTEIGVAIIIKEDSTYQVYWGQNFGSKKG
ncbi:MAG: Transporter [uncultured Sulfurovum sp.]|uniref:Transporter n=1 Tax=uncultured Sulfurovum sp. TaxID=269237 RepID=A0A6S6S5W8_9BACT|nr:MAG: Transporter [uncultured Sulfurovum sp.]